MALIQLNLDKLNAAEFSASCRSHSHAVRLMHDAATTEMGQLQAIIDMRRGLVDQLRRGGGAFGPVSVSAGLIAAVDDAVAHKSRLVAGVAAELEIATGMVGLCIPLVLSPVVDPCTN